MPFLTYMKQSNILNDITVVIGLICEISGVLKVNGRNIIVMKYSRTIYKNCTDSTILWHIIKEKLFAPVCLYVSLSFRLIKLALPNCMYIFQPPILTISTWVVLVKRNPFCQCFVCIRKSSVVTYSWCCELKKCWEN